MDYVRYLLLCDFITDSVILLSVQPGRFGAVIEGDFFIYEAKVWFGEVWLSDMTRV